MYPYEPTCTVNVLPVVRFFYRSGHYGMIEDCLVDMRMEAAEADNEECIKKVVDHYYISIDKEVYFIWIVHGWTNTGEDSWVLGMKDSYFHKYPDVHGLVLK